MKTTDLKLALLLPFFAGLALVFSNVAFAAAGKFQFVNGDVRVKAKSGDIRAAVKGGEVNEGDLILSGKPALAQLKMEDGGTIVVRPNTKFTIATYRFSGKEDGSERATYKLDQGSVRAITGQIGKTNKQNYLIQTPTASIGVRGTDHEPAYIPKKEDIENLSAKPGTYDKVNVGETYIETQGGVVVVKPNSVGYAEDERSVPTILPAVPGFYNQFTSGGGSGSSAAVSGAATSGSSVAMVDIVNPSSATVPGQNGANADVKQPIKTDVGTNLSAANVTSPLPPVSSNNTATLATYTSVQTSGFTQIEQARNLDFKPGSATLVDAGSNTALGVNWGRWDTGYSVDGLNTSASLHVVNATRLTTASELSALPITATYSVVSATRPTDELGRAGDLTKLMANVNFSTQKITDYAISANNAGRSWDAHGAGTFGQLLNSNEGLRLNGLCTGCQPDGAGGPVTSTANGFAKGAFVGSQAQGLITIYGLQANDKGISGAAVLTRP